MGREDFLTVEETAHVLGVSTRHVRRLADSGAVSRLARGLIDRSSVDQYHQSQRHGRTRAWAEHTAWGAIATLSDRDADWLGPVQASRLRKTLRDNVTVDDLLTRMRDRAQVRVFEAHRAALGQLREVVASIDLGQLGVTDAGPDRVDGYLAAGSLEDLVRSLRLRADRRGAVTLRVTTFDFSQVRELAAGPVVAALDAATSTDPRLRGLGRRTLAETLRAYRRGR